MRGLLCILQTCVLIFSIQFAWAEEELFDTKAAASFLEKGIEDLQAKKYQAAIEALEESVAISPDAEAYYYLGYAYYMKGRTGDNESRKLSLECFDKAFELNPRFTPTRFQDPESAIAQSGMAADESDTREEDDTFTSPTAGFSITKPKGWFFATTEQVAANRANARLNDKDLEDQVRQLANAPLIAIIKHKEPYDDLNPSVQVLLRPLGQLEGKSHLELMNTAIQPIKSAMVDFEFVEGIRETVVGGQTAAYAKSMYTATNAKGMTFPTLTRLWLVPHGKFMFMMSMSGPPTGPDVSEKEFAAILKSIMIDK